MSTISASVAATAMASTVERADAKPSFLRTYALVYAIGAVWLGLEIVLIGTQQPYVFTGTYVAAFMLPPFLTIGSLLLVDRRGSLRTVPLRVLGITTVAGLASILSTVVLTPLLALMFRERVGFSLSATGTVSWVSLLLVSWPLLVEMVSALRSGRLSHAAVLALGVVVTAVYVAMALDPSGSLATSMHRDQGAFLMVTSSWILPVFAMAVAYIRRLDTE
jgi:hypothetical protein